MRRKPVISLLGTSEVPVFKRRFLRTPKLESGQQRQVFNELVDEGFFKSGDDDNLKILKEAVSRAGSFWYRNPALCHYKWDAETLAESSLDGFINHYLHPFTHRLRAKIQVTSGGWTHSKDRNISSVADDWLHIAEINDVEWWIALESEEQRAENDWDFTIERYVQVLNTISAISGSSRHLYYENQGDEVVFVVVSNQLHDNLIAWRLLEQYEGSALLS